MCHDVVRLVAAICNQNNRPCKLRPIHHFHKCLRFILFPSVLYDGVQIQLTLQIVQRVQVQQVVATSVLCAVKVGRLVVDIARDLHMGAIYRQ